MVGVVRERVAGLNEERERQAVSECVRVRVCGRKRDQRIPADRNFNATPGNIICILSLSLILSSSFSLSSNVLKNK